MATQERKNDSPSLFKEGDRRAEAREGDGPPASRYRTFFDLSVLYFNQGLPYGFFTMTLPILAREQGMSAAFSGGLLLLALPWSFKVLWAPLVDRFGAARFGRRRSWILPIQILVPVLLLVLAGVTDPFWVAAGVLVLNLMLATQDTAVDALAVSSLRPADRGVGNAIQAGGYKVGMLVGGGLLPGLLMQEHAVHSWPIVVSGLAALTLPGLAVAFMVHEPAVDVPINEKRHAYRSTFRAVFGMPGAALFLAFLFFSKFGDNFGTGMFRVFLVDAGWSADRIATVVGTWGLVASIAGSLFMAWPLMKSRVGALWLAVIPEAVLMLAIAGVTSGVLNAALLSPLIVAEHFVSGMLTTVAFTVMMDRTPVAEAAGVYAFFMVVGSLGMGGGSVLGGVFTDAAGFTATFVVAAGLVLVPLGLYRNHPPAWPSGHVGPLPS